MVPLWQLARGVVDLQCFAAVLPAKIVAAKRGNRESQIWLVLLLIETTVVSSYWILWQGVIKKLTLPRLNGTKAFLNFERDDDVLAFIGSYTTNVCNICIHTKLTNDLARCPNIIHSRRLIDCIHFIRSLSEELSVGLGREN
jgi:hypothetical protein